MKELNHYKIHEYLRRTNTKPTSSAAKKQQQQKKRMPVDDVTQILEMILDDIRAEAGPPASPWTLGATGRRAALR